MVTAQQIKEAQLKVIDAQAALQTANNELAVLKLQLQREQIEAQNNG